MDASGVKSGRGVYFSENMRVSRRSTSYLDFSKKIAHRQNIGERTLSRRSCHILPTSPIKTGVEKILLTTKKTELNGRENAVLELVESYVYLFRAVNNEKKTLKIGENRRLELCNKSQGKEKDVFKALLKIVKDIEFGIDTKIYVLNIQGRNFSLSHFLQILRENYKNFLKKGKKRKKIKELIEQLEEKIERKNKENELVYRQKIEWIREKLDSSVLSTLSECSKELALELQIFTPKILALICPYFMDRERVLSEAHETLVELEDQSKKAFGKGDRYIKEQVSELLQFLEIYTDYLIKVKSPDALHCLNTSFSLMDYLEKFPSQLYPERAASILSNLKKVHRVRKSGRIDTLFPEWNLKNSSSGLLIEQEQISIEEFAKKISRFFWSGAVLLTTEDLLQGPESVMVNAFFEKSDEMLDWLKEHFNDVDVVSENIKIFTGLLKIWDKQGDFLTLSFMVEVLSQFSQEGIADDRLQEWIEMYSLKSNVYQRYQFALEDPHRPAPTPPFTVLVEELNPLLARLDSFREHPIEALEDFFLIGEILETFMGIHVSS